MSKTLDTIRTVLTEGGFVTYHKGTKQIKSMHSDIASAQKKADKLGKDYDTASHIYWQDHIKPKRLSEAKGHTIEAHGVKGMKSTPWRKTFKNHEHLHDWAEKNSAEVHATRDLEHVHSLPSQRTDTTAYGGSMTEAIVLSHNTTGGYHSATWHHHVESGYDHESAGHRAKFAYNNMHSRVKELTGASDTEARHYLDSVHGRHLHDVQVSTPWNADVNHYIKKDHARFKKTYHPDHFAEQVVTEVSAGAMSRAKEREEKQQADYHASMHRQHTDLAAAHRLSDPKAHKFHKDSAAAHSTAHKKLTGLALESVHLTESSHFIGTTQDKSGHKHTIWQHGQYSYGIHNNVTNEHQHIHHSLEHVKQHLRNMGHTGLHPSGFLAADGGSDQIGGGLSGPLMGEEAGPSPASHAKHIQQLIKKYRHNENENEHDKNAVLMAHHFGTPVEHQTAKAIHAGHVRDIGGHMSKMHGYFIKHLWPHDPSNPNRHPQPVKESKITWKDVKMHLAVHKAIDGAASADIADKDDGEVIDEAFEEGDRVKVVGSKIHGEGQTGTIHTTAPSGHFHVVKMDNDGGHASYHESNLKHHDEDMDESVINELSKKTLLSYVGKAADKGMQHAHAAGAAGMGSSHSDQERGAKQFGKAVGRLRGVKLAVKKLSEELPADADASDYIHDFVHSNNKVFKGDSVKQRIKRALGAWYAKHKGK